MTCITKTCEKRICQRTAVTTKPIFCIVQSCHIFILLDQYFVGPKHLSECSSDIRNLTWWLYSRDCLINDFSLSSLLLLRNNDSINYSYIYCNNVGQYTLIELFQFEPPRIFGQIKNETIATFIITKYIITQWIPIFLWNLVLI